MKKRIYTESGYFNCVFSEQDEGDNTDNCSETPRRNTSTGLIDDVNNKHKVSPNRIIYVLASITKKKHCRFYVVTIEMK